MNFPMNVMNPYDANITSSMMDTTQPHGSLNLIVLVLLGMTVIFPLAGYNVKRGSWEAPSARI